LGCKSGDVKRTIIKDLPNLMTNNHIDMNN